MNSKKDMTKVELINKIVELEPEYNDIRGRLWSSDLYKLDKLYKKLLLIKEKENGKNIQIN